MEDVFGDDNEYDTLSDISSTGLCGDSEEVELAPEGFFGEDDENADGADDVHHGFDVQSDDGGADGVVVNELLQIMKGINGGGAEDSGEAMNFDSSNVEQPAERPNVECSEAEKRRVGHEEEVEPPGLAALVSAESYPDFRQSILSVISKRTINLVLSDVTAGSQYVVFQIPQRMARFGEFNLSTVEGRIFKAMFELLCFISSSPGWRTGLPEEDRDGPPQAEAVNGHAIPEGANALHGQALVDGSNNNNNNNHQQPKKKRGGPAVLPKPDFFKKGDRNLSHVYTYIETASFEDDGWIQPIRPDGTIDKEAEPIATKIPTSDVASQALWCIAANPKFDFLRAIRETARMVSVLAINGNKVPRTNKEQERDTYAALLQTITRLAESTITLPSHEAGLFNLFHTYAKCAGTLNELDVDQHTHQLNAWGADPRDGEMRLPDFKRTVVGIALSLSNAIKIRQTVTQRALNPVTCAETTRRIYSPMLQEASYRNRLGELSIPFGKAFCTLPMAAYYSPEQLRDHWMPGCKPLENNRGAGAAAASAGGGGGVGDALAVNFGYEGADAYTVLNKIGTDAQASMENAQLITKARRKAEEKWGVYSKKLEWEVFYNTWRRSFSQAQCDYDAAEAAGDKVRMKEPHERLCKLDADLRSNQKRFVVEVMDMLKDPQRSCFGGLEIAKYWQDGIAQWSATSEVPEEQRTNFVNFTPTADIYSSPMANQVRTLMMNLDMAFGCAMSHLAFIQTMYVRSQCYDLSDDMMSTWVYLEGDPGAGKSWLINSMCKTVISYEEAQHTSTMVLATQVNWSQMLRVKSEISEQECGANAGFVDPKWKTTISERFVGNHRAHINHDTGQGEIASGGSFAKCAWLFAGNWPAQAFVHELRDRFVPVWVPSRWERPDTDVEARKYSGNPRDKYLEQRFIKSLKDENFWVGFLYTLDYIGVTTAPYDYSIANTLLDTFIGNLKKGPLGKIAVTPRQREGIMQMMKAWQMYFGVMTHFNSELSLMAGRCDINGRPLCMPELEWVLDLEQYKVITEETALFVISLNAESICNMRPLRLLTKVLKYSGAPKPRNMEDVMEESRMKKAERDAYGITDTMVPRFMNQAGADGATSFGRGNGAVNMNYQLVDRPLADVIREMGIGESHEWTVTEIEAAIDPHKQRHDFSGARGGYQQISTLCGGVNVRHQCRGANGKRVFKNGRKLYHSAPPIIRQQGKPGFFILVDLWENVFDTAITDALAGLRYEGMRKRGHCTPLGMVYREPNACAAAGAAAGSGGDGEDYGLFMDVDGVTPGGDGVAADDDGDDDDGNGNGQAREGRIWPSLLRTMRLGPGPRKLEQENPYAVTEDATMYLYQQVSDSTPSFANDKAHRATSTVISGSLEKIAFARHYERLYPVASLRRMQCTGEAYPEIAQSRIRRLYENTTDDRYGLASVGMIQVPKDDLDVMNPHQENARDLFYASLVHYKRAKANRGQSGSVKVVKEEDYDTIQSHLDLDDAAIDRSIAAAAASCATPELSKDNVIHISDAYKEAVARLARLRSFNHRHHQ